jgi:hypothetical protein
MTSWSQGNNFTTVLGPPFKNKKQISKNKEMARFEELTYLGLQMKGCCIEGQEPKGSRIEGQELKSLFLVETQYPFLWKNHKKLLSVERSKCCVFKLEMVC